MDQLFLREQDSQTWPCGIWKHGSHWYFFCFHPLLLKLYVICLANVFSKYFPPFFFYCKDSPPSWWGSSCYHLSLLQSQWKNLGSFCNRRDDSHVWYPFTITIKLPAFFLFLFLDLASYHPKFLDWFRCSIFWYWYFVLKIIIHPVIVDLLSTCIGLTPPTQCFKQALDVRQAVRLRLAPKAFLGGSTFFTQME